MQEAPFELIDNRHELSASMPQLRQVQRRQAVHEVHLSPALDQGRRSRPAHNAVVIQVRLTCKGLHCSLQWAAC